MEIPITRKTVIRLVMGSVIAQAVVIVRLLDRLDQTMDHTIEQGNFLATIINRNPEVLDDFDKIALKDLGLLKELD